MRQIMEMAACTGCRFCVEVCPAVNATEDGELSALYRMKGLNRLLRSRSGIIRKIFRTKAMSEEQKGHFGETVFRCTLCGNCQEACPVGIHLKELWLSLRQNLVQEDAYPNKIHMIRSHLEESHNVFDEDNEERAEWVEFMRNAPDHGYIKDRADVVYFTGCVASYFPLAQKIPMALAEIMDRSGVDFTLLGEDEWCCGFPLLGAGIPESFKAFMEHNVKAVINRGAERVIFACPSCYQMWREHYSHDFHIAHATQFLIELIRKDHIPLQELQKVVTYHDPCDLGRGSRVFDEPREIIRSIPGVQLVELSRNRENCQCCGGGGNLEMIDSKLVAKIAEKKIDEVLSTGADAVVTSCQQCLRTMMTSVRRQKIELEVLDITQLVQMALGSKKG